MASRKRDVHDSDGTEDPAPRRGLYRRIAGAFFGLIVAYLIGVGLVSVIPQIFWPEQVELPQDLSCREGLSQLREELLSYSSGRVRSPDGVAAGFGPFFDNWDNRHVALESRCASGNEQDAWELLGRLRQRVQGTLERYDREEAELARALDSTLTGRSR